MFAYPFSVALIFRRGQKPQADPGVYTTTSACYSMGLNVPGLHGLQSLRALA